MSSIILLGNRAARERTFNLFKQSFNLIRTFTTTTPLTRSVLPQLNRSVSIQSSSFIISTHALHSLTDPRFPKRRPGFTNRKKRATLKPPGPYAWVKYTPGEPILANRPNQGSLKRRNEKKRIGQHKAFIKIEAKKRKVQLQAAKKKKIEKRIERKMAAVARERAWVQRLAELQQLEAEKKAATATNA
ncbi:hypothetical protein ACHQM5_016935 [Ranunculus cassubicifolius]